MSRFRSDRKADRESYLESKDALRLLKLPWHSVWSKDKINHPGTRRAGRWMKYGVKK